MERTAPVIVEPSRERMEVLTRTLRHEVGDLLQTVYATVAILQERLPAEQALERRILADLRVRAETCKNELDAVHDLICPMQLNLEPFDLAELCASLAAVYGRRYPNLQLSNQAGRRVATRGDSRRLNQVGQLLLGAACQNAQSQVVVQAGPGDREATVDWVFEDDGPQASAEVKSWLAQPFSTTHHALVGLGLALGRRVAEAHGGNITVASRAPTGIRVCMTLPAAQPGAEGASD